MAQEWQVLKPRPWLSWLPSPPWRCVAVEACHATGRTITSVPATKYRPSSRDAGTVTSSGWTGGGLRTPRMACTGLEMARGRPSVLEQPLKPQLPWVRPDRTERTRRVDYAREGHPHALRLGLHHGIMWVNSIPVAPQGTVVARLDQQGPVRLPCNAPVTPSAPAQRPCSLAAGAPFVTSAHRLHGSGSRPPAAEVVVHGPCCLTTVPWGATSIPIAYSYS